VIEPSEQSTDPTGSPRRVLLVVNTRRDEVTHEALDAARRLISRGLAVRVLTADAEQMPWADSDAVERVEAGPEAARDCDLVLVLGGDGTILRGAELARETGTPLLGINLGHVGFLAEADHDDLELVMEAVVDGRYRAEERLTVDVSVFVDDVPVASTWALNEASVEKASRERMLEVQVEIDGRPLSRWGCDGVVCSTPTGSTAYNFSAGGPVVWPEVQALLVVPISAHALFARPMVVAPSSVISVEVIESNDGCGVLWCDGRRTVDLPPGARIEVRRGHQPVHLVRLHEAPFTDRLVAKFGLPVEGWRGAAQRRRRGDDA
jgi:NAD+ kinase